MAPEDDAALAADACAREPIHVIGQIQSHGLLFALSEPGLIVAQVSANVTTILGTSPERVLGRSLADVLGERQFQSFRAYVGSMDDLRSANPLRVRIGAAGLVTNCIAHRQDGVLIAEFELLNGTYSLEPLNFAAHIEVPLARMEAAPDVLDLARIAANEIRRLSGFERVMVYRFDERWNGEVIAETAGDAPASYLGLHFPASDIPAQARRLFFLNPLRAIADVDSAPVPIVPEIGPLTGRALDLTRTFLRSASPLHVEYLRNMNVGASLTLSITVQGRLWGLIACHHPAPRPVDCLTRSICGVVGRMLASQIALRIDNAALRSRLESRKLLETYMAGIETATVLPRTQLFDGPRLRELLDADGLLSRIDGVVSSEGTTVDEESLLPVIGKLRRFASRGIASSDMLGALDRGAETYADRVSGALFLGLSEGSAEYVLLVRRELVATVTWAGNPQKAVNTDADGTLRPRTSFAAWREAVRGRARPWTELELESARFLREQLLRLRDAAASRVAAGRAG